MGRSDYPSCPRDHHRVKKWYQHVPNLHPTNDRITNPDDWFHLLGKISEEEYAGERLIATSNSEVTFVRVFLLLPRGSVLALRACVWLEVVHEDRDLGTINHAVSVSPVVRRFECSTIGVPAFFFTLFEPVGPRVVLTSITYGRPVRLLCFILCPTPPSLFISTRMRAYIEHNAS
ncbi:hypothetical protein BDM02DRAFT_2704081 [Thelephora ganbajun]|uniref:Uncharacterized protein n=1 Tax=Thelephora ganbajun TaxID=370292 RepID=A0ACB6YXA3_THEGA|nr:hypothetical protein BDM02DRAFT_2704081 [Thelephora ganbajun]